MWVSRRVLTRRYGVMETIWIASSFVWVCRLLLTRVGSCGVNCMRNFGQHVSACAMIGLLILENCERRRWFWTFWEMLHIFVRRYLTWSPVIIDSKTSWRKVRLKLTKNVIIICSFNFWRWGRLHVLCIPIIIIPVYKCNLRQLFQRHKYDFNPHTSN